MRSRGLKVRWLALSASSLFLAFGAIVMSTLWSGRSPSAFPTGQGWRPFNAEYRTQEFITGHQHERLFDIEYSSPTDWTLRGVSDSVAPDSTWSSRWDGRALTLTSDGQSLVLDDEKEGPIHNPFPAPWAVQIASRDDLLSMGWSRHGYDGAISLRTVGSYDCTRSAAFECDGLTGHVEDVYEFVRDKNGLPLSYVESMGGRVVRRLDAVGVPKVKTDD